MVAALGNHRGAVRPFDLVTVAETFAERFDDHRVVEFVMLFPQMPRVREILEGLLETAEKLAQLGCKFVLRGGAVVEEERAPKRPLSLSLASAADRGPLIPKRILRSKWSLTSGQLFG